MGIRRSLAPRLACLLFLFLTPKSAEASPIGLVTNGAYSAWYDTATAFNRPAVYIAGPNGTEQFVFQLGFPGLEIYGALKLNPYGQLVGWGFVFGDEFGFYAIYGHGGSDGLGVGFGSAGVQPGQTVPNYFGGLGWPVTPPGCSSCFGGELNPIMALDDDGTAHGTINYSLGAPPFAYAATWELGDLRPIPEPSTLILIGSAFAALAARRATKKNQ